MPWDARKVSDYELHRHRIAAAAVGLVGAAMLLVVCVLGLSEGSLSAKDIMGAVGGFAMVAYFGSMVVRARKQMRDARQAGS